LLVRGVAVTRKAPPSKTQTTTFKRAACGLAVPPYHRAKPIYLPSNATVANRGRPPAFFETLARPSTLRASRLRIPRRVQVPRYCADVRTVGFAVSFRSCRAIQGGLLLLAMLCSYLVSDILLCFAPKGDCKPLVLTSTY